MAGATASQPELEQLLMWLSDLVGRRLRAGKRRASVVTIGMMHHTVRTPATARRR